jgi:hypothetical protein
MLQTAEPPVFFRTKGRNPDTIDEYNLLPRSTAAFFGIERGSRQVIGLDCSLAVYEAF